MRIRMAWSANRLWCSTATYPQEGFNNKCYRDRGFFWKSSIVLLSSSNRRVVSSTNNRMSPTPYHGTQSFRDSFLSRQGVLYNWWCNQLAMLWPRFELLVSSTVGEPPPPILRREAVSCQKPDLFHCRRSWLYRPLDIQSRLKFFDALARLG